MADFNLSAEVSMDVDPLKASKTTIERNLKAINKSLRDQRKEMKQNEASAESLAKQETDLGRAIKLQEGLMAQRNKELQDQQKEMKNSNKVTDEQKIKLQNLNAAYEQSKKQLDGYTNEMKGVQVQQKTFGKTTNDVKNNLNDLRNEVKLSQAEFEKSSKATNDYERHINSLTGSLSKSEKQLGQLDDNLKIVSELKGENSREAKALRSEISKEQLAFKQLELQLGKTKTSFNEYQEENSESAIAMRKLDDAIDNTKQSISEMNNSLKLSNAEFNNSSKESDDYKNHLRTLTTTQSKQIQIINELEDEYNQVSLSQGKASQQAQDLKNEIAKQNVTFTNLKNQINTTTNEYDDFRLANSETNLTLGEAKRRLEDMNNELKMSSLKFKQSEKTTDDYKNKITQLKTTMIQQGAVITGMNQRYDELKRNKRENSVEAIKLRNDIAKEALAFQVLQGRIDETTDELKEYQRQQRLMGTATRAWEGARDSMDRIATTLRSLGELTQGIVGGVMTTHFSALVPILGSIVSLGAGLGGMLVASAGGAIGMGGAFGIAGIAVQAFAGQATYALKMLEDGQLRVTNEVTAYQTALDRLKTSWEGLIAQNQAAIFNTMTNGINTARFALNTLNPFLTKTATQIETASGKMLDWAKNSANAKKAFDILNTQGPKIFQHLLNATQSFVNGSTALFNKLSPLYGWAAKGFSNMAKSFDNWANSVQGSKAINGFIEYTKTNLPIVGSIFGNIFSGIISLFQAFSGHSHTVLLGIQDVTKGFAEWSEGLKKSDGFKQFVQYLEVNGPKVWTLIKNITSTLWGLAKGMAPVGAAVLSMSGAFFKWTATMTNAHPIIGKILGIMTALGGVTLLAAKPILLLGGALKGATGATTLFGNAGAIAAIKTKLFATNTGVLTVAMKVARGQLSLQTVLTGKYSLATKGAAIANKALALSFKGIGIAIRSIPVIGWIITGITALVGATIYLWKTNEGFRNAVIGIWNSIKSAAIATFGFLKPYIVGIWNGIKTASIFVWNVLKSAAIATWNGIKFAVQNPMKALRSVITAIWNGIKTYFTWVWGLIRATVSGAVNGISNVIKTVFGAINTFIKWIFNGIANFVKMVWNSKILAPIRWAVQAINVVVRIIFAAVSKFIKWIFNGVASFVKTVWNNIKNSISFYANLIKKLVTAAWNILSRVTKAIFNGIKNFLIGVWSNIRDRVVSIARAIWAKIKPIWDTFSRVTRNIFNSIKNFLIGVWTTIRNRVVAFAKSLWAKVKPVWDTLSRVSRNIFNSLKNFFIGTWTTIRNKVSGFASSMWSKVSGTWNKLSGGTKKIFNSVRNYLVDKWNGIKDKVTGIASSLWSSVKDTFTNMKNGLKGLAGKIGDVITGMVKGIKKGLNSLIKGVNWVAEKLGVDEKIPLLSTGTAGTSHSASGMGAGVSNGVVSSGGFATVNDRGPGNGTGASGHQEVIQRANGQMIAPKGRDVTVPLGKGDIVHSGRAVKRAQQAGMFPKFSRGTGRNNLLKDAKKKKHEHGGMDAIGTGLAKSSAWGVAGGGNKIQEALVGTLANGAKKTGDAYNSGKKKVKKGAETGKKVVEAGAKSVGKIAGDLLEYVGNPGKLVEAMMKKFGVNFGKIKGQIPKDMMWDPMWKGLKGGVKSLFDGWLTEADGAGDGGYIDLSHGINYGFGFPPGYPFNRPHNGLDIGYPYGSKLYSTLSGKATAKSGYNGGFGNSMWINNGKGMEAIYGHMSKLAWSGTKNVKPGSYLGLSGGDPSKQGASAGDSTGPHLHYEMRKNGKPFDPTNWLKTNNGSKGGGKWKSTVKKALKIAGLPTSGKYVNAWLKQIDTESGGNAKAMGGTDGLADGRAQGLVQVKPGTFNAYKMKGHGNIMKGLDNLIAGMRYADAKYGNAGLSQIGKGVGYATGTNNARRGFHQVFEEGGEIMQMRGGETVIPNDVSIQAFKQIASSDIFNRTQTAVYDAISQYADQLREKQQTATREQQELQRLSQANVDIQEQNSILKEMLYTMQDLLTSSRNNERHNAQTAGKDMTLDGKKISKNTNKHLGKESNNRTYTLGGGAFV